MEKIRVSAANAAAKLESEALYRNRKPPRDARQAERLADKEALEWAFCFIETNVSICNKGHPSERARAILQRLIENPELAEGR